MAGRPSAAHRAFRRPAAWGGGLALALLALTGCVRLASVQVAQNPLDRVAITVEVCAAREGTACPRGTTTLDMTDGIGQALLGFRVPVATVEPDSFASSAPAGAVSFAKSASLSAELERLAPTGAATRWVGYLSNAVNYSTAGPQSFTATASFGLVQGPDGAPFPRPLKHRVVAGSRISQGNLAPTRPVVCGQSELTGISADQSTVCANSPTAATIATDDAFKTRDAGVLAGSARATAAPKSLAALPFTIRYSGAGGDDAPRLTLSAATTLPGATATATPDVAIPSADGSVQALVTVAVPAGAAPGDYGVSLTATAPASRVVFPILGAQAAPNPRSRVGLGTLTVLPAGALAGADVKITAATAKVRFSRSRSSGFVQIRGTAGRAASLNVQIKRRGRVESKGRSPTVRTVIFRATKVSSGPFRKRIRVPAGLLPGAYDVWVVPLTTDGIALPRRTARVKLQAPEAGVVDSAFASDSKGGPSLRRSVTRPRILFANFRFAVGALPGRGPKLRPSIQWFRNGKAIGRLETRPRKRSLTAFLRLRSRGPLPTGRYRAVLKSGSVVVAVAEVRIG